MPRRTTGKHGANDLTPLEEKILRFCSEDRRDMVHLVDLTTALAELPRALQGPWFALRLLAPDQKKRYTEVVRDVNRAMRRLFRAKLIDIGREDSYSEGFTRHHREIVAAMHTDSYWQNRSGSKGQMPSMDVIAENVRFHQTWADVTDLRAAAKEMGGDVELIGLTPNGREHAQMLLSDRTAAEPPEPLR